MTDKLRISSQDLWRLQFVGDPRVSPDGNSIVYVQTEPVPDENGYRSALWMATRADDNGWTSRQFTFPSSANGLVREHSPRWSPGGDQLAFISNRDGKAALYVIPAGGGEARRIAVRKTSISQPAWSPDGSSIAFVSPDPEELETDYAAFAALRDTDGADTDSIPRWNGKKLPEPSATYVTRLRYKFNGVGLLDDRYRHIFVVDLESGEITRVTSGPYNNQQPAWSPAGDRLAFVSARRPDREFVGLADLWTVIPRGGEPERVIEASGPILHPTWSPDGQLIAYIGHEQGEFSAANSRVYIVASAGGTIRCLTSDFDRSAGNSVGGDTRFNTGGPGPFWSADGSSLLFVATAGGASHVYEVDVATENLEQLTRYPETVTSLHVQPADKGAKQTLAVVGHSWNVPGEVFVGTGGPGGPVRELTRATSINEPLMQARQLAQPERFEFETFDGQRIEAWIMKPVGFEEGKLYPVVLEIHGGPAGTYGDSYMHEFQVLAARGFGVLFTNPRGSKGYGEAWARGVIGDWGGGDYADLMACVDHAVANFSWIDPDRLGVTGGSYGGYMTNWIVGQTDRFRSAVTQRSISNMYTKYGVSDIGFFGNKAGMGGADLWDDEDFIMSRSPIRYAPRVRTPILIIHSENDLRCPMEQAEQWYVALRRLGNVDVEFVRFAGETHELSRSGKPVNRVERLEQIAGWFERYNT